MRFLVTGASGFIGKNVVTALQQRGHEVVAVGTRATHGMGEHGVEWLRADLLQPGECETVINASNVTGLVHCAWDTTPGAYWTTPNNLKWVAASLHLLDAFQRHGGKRCVIAGTSAEYDWSSLDLLNESNSSIAPNLLYGNCKYALQIMVEEWAKMNDVSWAWARIFCPFGPEEREERLVPKLITRLLSGVNLPFDSGHLIRDFLCVTDLGDAFAAVADSSIEGTINLASGRGVSIRELVTMIAMQLGRLDQVQFDIRPEPVGEPMRIVADVRRLQNELGWMPQCTLDQRIAETCDWWQAQLKPVQTPF